MKYKVYGINIDHVGRETRHYMATFNDYENAEDFAYNYNLGYDKNVVEIENDEIHNINLFQQPGIILPEVTRVRYLVKVKNEHGECTIYHFNNREIALANAFNAAKVCRDCKIYFVRCLTI